MYIRDSYWDKGPTLEEITFCMENDKVKQDKIKDNFKW